MVKKIGYSLHYIKDAKHFSNGDNPEQVNSEIALFIKNLSICEGTEQILNLNH